MSKTCINTKSPEFLKLVRDSGLSPMLLSAKVALWMDKNNTNEFPTLNQIGVSSLNKESSSQTSDRNNVEFKELFSYSDKNKQHIGVLLSKLSLMGGKTFFILKEFEKRLFKNTYYSFATAGELREQFSDFKDSDIAFYDPKSNTVFINSSNKKNNDSKLFSDTIIHEIAHAASVNRYHEIKSKINSGTATKSEIDLFNEIDKIYSIAKIELQDKFPQYFQDKNSQLEFLNGIFDNSFVDELNNIEYASKQSIFDRFLGVLMHMLGIKEKTIGEAAFKSLFNLSDIKSDKQFEESFTSSIHKIDSNFVGYNKDDFSDDTKKILEDGGKIKVSMIINDDGTEDQGETYESVDDKNNLYNRVTYGAKSLKDAFLPYSKAQKKDYATYLADKIWKDAPHDSKLSIDGKVQDYNEYLESVKIKVKRGTGVGNILHAMNELVNTNNVDKIASIRAKISRIKEDNGFSKDQFNWFTDNISDIYSTLGINKFKDIPVELKDKIACEVSVYNDLIKYAGSIDMLVENQEIYTDYETGKTGQYLSLYDLKSGYSIINGLATSILKYGEQCRYITNSAMDMSKLQVALYAVMIKMNNPSQRFKRLQVVSIANKYVATTEHPESIVDVESYIPMIEAFFKDKNNLKELGLPIDVYDKMILNNKNLFNYEHYRKAEMPERMADGIDSIDEQLAVLEQKLKEPGFKDSSKRVNEIKDQMIDLMRQKKALESYDNVNDSSLSQAQETSKLAF